MSAVFADSGYWIALLSPRDNLHHRAKEIARQLGDARVVTSELVLIEVLNIFADKGAALRRAAAETAQAIMADPNIEVVPHTRQLFTEAQALYGNRVDKAWSLTDCASFLIMDQRQILEALAHDQHFSQKGYRALLRDA
jgi:uncharacterized protein